MPLLMFQIHDSRQNTQVLLPDNIPQQHIILNTAHIRFKKDDPNGGEPITVEPNRLQHLHVCVQQCVCGVLQGVPEHYSG